MLLFKESKGEPLNVLVAWGVLPVVLLFKGRLYPRPAQEKIYRNTCACSEGDLDEAPIRQWNKTADLFFLDIFTISLGSDLMLSST